MSWRSSELDSVVISSFCIVGLKYFTVFFGFSSSSRIIESNSDISFTVDKKLPLYVSLIFSKCPRNGSEFFASSVLHYSTVQNQKIFSGILIGPSGSAGPPALQGLQGR